VSAYFAKDVPIPLMQGKHHTIPGGYLCRGFVIFINLQLKTSIPYSIFVRELLFFSVDKAYSLCYLQSANKKVALHGKLAFD